MAAWFQDFGRRRRISMRQADLLAYFYGKIESLPDPDSFAPFLSAVNLIEQDLRARKNELETFHDIELKKEYTDLEVMMGDLRAEMTRYSNRLLSGRSDANDVKFKQIQSHAQIKVHSINERFPKS